MTINSQIRVAGPYVGNGTTATFPFGFKVFKADDLHAVRTDVAGVEVPLFVNADFTVALNADQNSNPGGFITLPANLSTGFKLLITSNIAPLQRTQLTNQGGFFPGVITDMVDRLTILQQQAQTVLDRSVKFPLSSAGVQTELPSGPTALGKALLVDPATGGVTVSDVVFNDQIDIVSGIAGDAAAQAALAMQQAVNANGSAAAAAGSAGAALDAASQLQSYIDDASTSGLTFPYDMGLIADPVVSNKFDLGTL